MIKINNTAINQEIMKLASKRNAYFVNSSAGSRPVYAYKMNIITVYNKSLPPFYADGVQYLPEYFGIYFVNISVPLNFIQVSNNVNKYDNYQLLSLYTELEGEASWEAISGYGGPYIGI
ncbi:hypothetical protein SJAV_19220 [Sulfurisphaera javensis]|uniref:Uncharacterized protein n=1 Tax=Sulfurisphaera javensis TaxID=2049879 RepID=A0AAT9GSY3_9CREN